MGLQGRFLGPRPPLVINALPTQIQETVTVQFSNAVMRRAQAQRHFAKSQLFPPPTLAQPPPAVVYGPTLHLAPSPRVARAPHLRLFPPTVVATSTFVAAPIRVAL